MSEVTVLSQVDFWVVNEEGSKGHFRVATEHDYDVDMNEHIKIHIPEALELMDSKVNKGYGIHQVTHLNACKYVWVVFDVTNEYD